MQSNRLVAGRKIGGRRLVIAMNTVGAGTAGGARAWSATSRVDMKAVLSPPNRSGRVTEESKWSKKSSHCRKGRAGKNDLLAKIPVPTAGPEHEKCERTTKAGQLHLGRCLAAEALEMDLGQRSPDEGLIHHSDQGCQYVLEDQQAILMDYCMLGSMCRRDNCPDHAPVESFFGTLKTERVRRRQYRTRSEAKRDLFQYIEVWYNRKHLHSAPGHVSPVEFEAQHHPSRETSLATEG